MTAIHQVVSTLEIDDAVGNEVCMIRERLLAAGHLSEIFTVVQRGNEPAPVHDLAALLDGPAPELVLYHFATASPATAQLAGSTLPLALVYHNVTPEMFFWGIDRDHFDACRGASKDVLQLRDRVRIAFAHSEYSRRELARSGFRNTATFPLLLDTQGLPGAPAAAADQRDAGAVLLSVGRIAPNKCLEDTVRLLHAVRQDVAPDARLWIAGDGSRLPRYAEALRRLVDRLGDNDAVRWLGRLPRPELVRTFHRASVYVSMSEHEGFGGPLVEAMSAGVPVLAFDAAAVAETLGGAGLLLRSKRMPMAAELVGQLLRDAELRRDCVARGQRRAAALHPDRAFEVLVEQLRDHQLVAA
jgi:glycosyltransferase involved in cell wall biosynthesis